MHNYPYSSGGELTNANVAQNHHEWNDHHLHDPRAYDFTTVSPSHDAVSICSQDSVKSTPEVRSPRFPPRSLIN